MNKTIFRTGDMNEVRFNSCGFYDSGFYGIESVGWILVNNMFKQCYFMEVNVIDPIVMSNTFYGTSHNDFTYRGNEIESWRTAQDGSTLFLCKNEYFRGAVKHRHIVFDGGQTDDDSAVGYVQKLKDVQAKEGTHPGALLAEQAFHLRSMMNSIAMQALIREGAEQEEDQEEEVA